MSDQLEEIFARTRPSAIRAIRPPGAEAARRTVRIRRTRRAVSLAAIVVLAVVGGVIAGMRPPPPPEKRELPADPVKLTQTAKVALGTSSTPAAVEKATEVKPGWVASSTRYFGGLTLRATCAGDGSLTLAVIGNPGSEMLQTEPVELARLDVPCAEKPEPVETAFEIGQNFPDVDYKIVDVGTPAKPAGLAFRITSDTGEPLTAQDERANPTFALHLTSDKGFGSGGGITAGRRGLVDDLPSHVGGWFRVLGACAGRGTLRVDILKASGKVVDTVRVPCQWPPKRYDFEPARGSGDLRYRITFESSKPFASADFMVQFVPR
ncbi:hypothetical protein [Actinoplanes sp. NPDC049802]|uniref:hypothetical protein n=1 Tax=Actinoplanes sp. NPDC049802 TaxID=3154742 RepID=UPI0033E33541